MAVPSTFAAHGLDASRLRAVEIEGIGCGREMFVVIGRCRVLPVPTRRFVSLLDADPVPALMS